MTKSKPDPEIFTEAAGQFAKNPPLAEQILVFEDLRMVSCSGVVLRKFFSARMLQVVLKLALLLACRWGSVA